MADSTTLEPFATSTDYTARGYDAARFASLDVLDARLAAASRHVRGRCRGIDDRIEAGRVDVGLVVDVVCAMVSRTTPSEGMDGVTSMQETTGPFSFSRQFSNPAGALYLTKDERRLLGCGAARAFSVDLTQPLGDAS